MPTGQGEVTPLTDAPYVSVLGPARAPDDLYELAVELGGRLADTGAIVVCGGLGGIMEAVAKGAAERGGTVVGLLPTLERATANRHVTIAIPTGLGELRNGLVIRAGDAVIVVGCSWGTLSEVALAMRTGVPLVALSPWEVRDACGADLLAAVRAESPAAAVAAALQAIAARRRG